MRVNPKSEYRNSKQFRNFNASNSKRKYLIENGCKALASRAQTGQYKNLEFICSSVPFGSWGPDFTSGEFRI